MTEAATETEESTLDWIWGAIQGDFNENPTIGQIITNAAITAIPLVDQVADGRDLVANLKALIWDKRYNEMAVWVGLFFTLIGLIPSLGSLLKGVLKLIYRGAKLDDVFRAFNALAKGNAWERLKKLRAGELRQHADEAARMLKQVFDNIIATLKEALSYVPSWADDLYKNISDLIAEMRAIRDQIDEMFGKITADLEAKLDDLLKQQADNSVEGNSRQTLMMRQEAEAPKRTDDFGKNLSNMSEADAKRIIESSSKAQLKKLAATSRAGVSELGILSKNYENLPAKIPSFPGVSVDGKNFTITDDKAYMQNLEAMYETSGNPLHSKTKTMIQNQLDVIKSRRPPVSDTLAGLPGLHAEVQSTNDIYGQLEKKGLNPFSYDDKIEVVTYKIAPSSGQGGEFNACTNCSGILKPPIKILTGRKS